MSIGGRDILIPAPPDVSPAEVVLRSMRQLWPDSVFQDADQEDYHPVDSPWVLIQGGRSREFFVFMNREAAEAWHHAGATPANANSMLHFLVEDPPPSRRSPQQITMVCDELSEMIEQLVDDLSRSFRGSRRPKLPAHAA